jgi:hypothetical protein
VSRRSLKQGCADARRRWQAIKKLVALSFCDEAQSFDRRTNLEGPKMSNWMSVEKSVWSCVNWRKAEGEIQNNQKRLKANALGRISTV